MSDVVTNAVTGEAPAPSAASRARLEGERTDLEQRLADLTVPAEELSGPGDSVDHAQSLERQFEQEHVRARLIQLEELLSQPPRSEEDIPAGMVGIGSRVRLRFAGGDEQSYLLATIEEQEGDDDILTFDSPLGRALLGHHEGDDITYTAPAGSMKVTVVSIGVPEA